MATPTVRLVGEARQKRLPRKVRFTQAALDAIVVGPGEGRTWVYDAVTPNLAVMKTAGGSRSFYFVGKLHGRTVRHRLGGVEITIEQARKQCVECKAGVGRGLDPGAERRAVSKAITLQQLWERYRDTHGTINTSANTQRNDAGLWGRHLAGWASKRALSLTADEIKLRHEKLTRENGGTVANRVVQFLRRMLNWAQLPCPINRHSVRMNRERSRSRFLNADEVKRLFVAIDDEPLQHAKDLIRLALFTGARRSNLCSMRWDELDLRSATWTVPGAKSKSGEPMPIHLPSEAVAILAERHAAASEEGGGGDSPYVFPGTGKGGHLVDPKKSWASMLKRAKITDFHFHDLRRTLGSWSAATGASLPIIGKALGHNSTDSTKVYARLQLDPVRAAVDTAVAAMFKAAGPDAPAD